MNDVSLKFAEQQLQRLADAKAQMDALNERYAQLREAILPDYVKEALSALDEEMGPLLEQAQKVVAEAETHVKRTVLVHGRSVKAAGYHAVLSEGRVKWDDKALEGYAAAHPEVNHFRSQGDPYVTLRREK